VTTSEFEDVKERLAALENRHKLIDPEERKKPTLRRASSGADKRSQDGNDDGRPTLKRRDDEN
jgi:beta-barrel assembly-enhancing protease